MSATGWLVFCRLGRLLGKKKGRVHMRQKLVFAVRVPYSPIPMNKLREKAHALGFTGGKFYEDHMLPEGIPRVETISEAWRPLTLSEYGVRSNAGSRTPDLFE